jgi:hypothetical protein
LPKPTQIALDSLDSTQLTRPEPMTMLDGTVQLQAKPALEHVVDLTRKIECSVRRKSKAFWGGLFFDKGAPPRRRRRIERDGRDQRARRALRLVSGCSELARWLAHAKFMMHLPGQCHRKP